jgi:hypothetical protein
MGAPMRTIAIVEGNKESRFPGGGGRSRTALVR